MARIAQSIRVEPARLPDHEREQLARELFQVHDAIFAGTDLPAFINLVMFPPAEHSSLLLHRDENGRLVGYCTMHRFRRQIGGRTCSVLRVQSGLYKEFRGKNSNITFLMSQVMYHWLQHPLRPLYFFGVMLHPSSYAVLHRFSHRFWPAPGQDDHHPLAAKAYELFASFNITPVSPDRPFIANLGILTREGKDDHQIWQNSTKPSDRFFLSVNPGYRQGDGLLALVPLSPVAVGHALARWLKMRKQKRAR
ncbi:hypothetical protein B0T37_06330 [Chromobacterium violaceum]|uniref:hypothetical protein n=1 Tax=Chromobacterium violaceum TaxID=536 RepID=UPI0009D9A20B|nr:hypothetical protein [Chromobacterium violaceum]OQS12095.1 hypothetical protein B0T38_00960 [Chromobacterium violaceum]OQS28468.1 hypothetical protein B0T37_06330 [Chromobacterium violaceum]